MTTTASTAVVIYDPDLVDPEHVALGGFLGGYQGLTRDAYALDLHQFVAFCERRHLGLFDIRRSDIETSAGNSRRSRPGDSDDRSPVVHDHRLLPLRRRGRPHRALPGGPRPPAPHRL